MVVGGSGRCISTPIVSLVRIGDVGLGGREGERVVGGGEAVILKARPSD